MGVKLFSVDSHSQKGVERENNQDALGIMNWRSNPQMPDGYQVVLTDSELPKLFLLADGVGGHENGAIASRIAIDTIFDQFNSSAQDFNIKSAISLAHSVVTQQPQYLVRQMGTTVVGLILCPSGNVVFNVGDSRAYLATNDQISLVSVDDVVPKGPSNLITQCIGGGRKNASTTPSKHWN